MVKQKKQEAKDKKMSVDTSKIDEKDVKIKELTELVKRIQAEFENYKKRTEREFSDFKKYANANLVEKLLPILDNFELAFKNKDGEEFKKGIEMIYAQLLETLDNGGLKKINAEGKQFDPYKHEALLSEESDQENIVLEELQPGYLFGEKVLRHSKVKISKAKKVNKQE